MEADGIFFTCSLCGKKHAALPPLVPDFSPEEVEKRRQDWLTAEGKLAKSPNEQNQKVYLKAWFAYMETESNGVPRLPPTITTDKKGGAHFFLCVDHEQIKEKVQESTQSHCHGDDCQRQGSKASIQRQACPSSQGCQK